MKKEIVTESWTADVSSENAIQILKNKNNGGTKLNSEATSARVAKWFPEFQRGIVLAALSKSHSRYASFLQDYILATIATGHRPLEWYKTEKLHEQTDYCLILRIWNRKYTNDRSNGLYRTLRWKYMDSNVLAAINRMLQAAAECETEINFDKLLRNSEKYLCVLCGKIFPDAAKGIALYSCRHQFAANMKRIYSKAEVATVLGHASDATAFRAYGVIDDARESGGSGAISNIPEPDQAEVSRVRAVYSKETNRLASLSKSSDSDQKEKECSEQFDQSVDHEIPEFPYPLRNQMRNTPEQMEEAKRLGLLAWQNWRSDFRNRFTFQGNFEPQEDLIKSKNQDDDDISKLINLNLRT